MTRTRTKEAFEAQAGSADESRELCDIFGRDPSGRHDERRDRLLSLLSGPPSRRRLGWLHLLLQVHAAGAQSFDELEPNDLEAAVQPSSTMATMTMTLILSLWKRIKTHWRTGQKF